MTLNLMLTSTSAVYLSGDFCLTYSGKREKTNPCVQKLVPVVRLRWSALVSFAGIAQTSDGLDVGNWIAEQMQDIPMGAYFGELPRRLLTADTWLRKVPPKDRRLTFSIVGFYGRHKRPVTMIISSFMDNNEHITSLQPQLKQYTLRSKKPTLRALPDPKAIIPEERSKLEKMVTAKHGFRDISVYRDINAELADLNATIAQRSSGISQSCVVGHLLKSGSADVIPYRVDMWGEYVPDFVKRHLTAIGVDSIKRKVDGNGRPLPPKWRSMSAKVQNIQGNDVAVVIHGFANLEEELLLSGVLPNNTQIFTKTVEENEPDRYNFQVNLH
jgi:hypothetical protein